MPRKKAVPAAESAQVETKPAAEKPEPKKKGSILEKVSTKKTPAKKSAEKAERVEEIYLQADGAEWNVADCKARAIAAYMAEGHRESSVKKLIIYLKPEEGKAYFVINDRMTGSVDL